MVSIHFSRADPKKTRCETFGVKAPRPHSDLKGGKARAPAAGTGWYWMSIMENAIFFVLK